jgi:ADP-glucose pyrophosphorylase
VLAVYDVKDLEQVKKYNSISVDAAGRITFFEEKPANPTSTLTGIALYFYPKGQQYVLARNTSGAPRAFAGSRHLCHSPLILHARTAEFRMNAERFSRYAAPLRKILKKAVACHQVPAYIPRPVSP